MHSRDPYAQGHNVPQATHLISLDCMTEIFISKLMIRITVFKVFCHTKQWKVALVPCSYSMFFTTPIVFILTKNSLFSYKKAGGSIKNTYTTFSL
jgi:hypothetical protein